VETACVKLRVCERKKKGGPQPKTILSAHAQGRVKDRLNAGSPPGRGKTKSNKILGAVPEKEARPSENVTKKLLQKEEESRKGENRLLGQKTASRFGKKSGRSGGKETSSWSRVDIGESVKKKKGLETNLQVKGKETEWKGFGLPYRRTPEGGGGEVFRDDDAEGDGARGQNLWCASQRRRRKKNKKSRLISAGKKGFATMKN